MSFAMRTCRRIGSTPAVSRYYTSGSVPNASSSSAHSPSRPKKQKAASHHSLPSTKMRALIALYHQSENWITKENLLQRIDETFVPDTTDVRFLNSKSTRQPTIDELMKERARMRIAPKMAPWDATNNNVVAVGNADGWSDTSTRRENKVIEALYGVHVVDGKLNPGLEILEATPQLIEKEKARQEPTSYDLDNQPKGRRS